MIRYSIIPSISYLFHTLTYKSLSKIRIYTGNYGNGSLRITIHASIYTIECILMWLLLSRKSPFMCTLGFPNTSLQNIHFILFDNLIYLFIYVFSYIYIYSGYSEERIRMMIYATSLILYTTIWLLIPSNFSSLHCQIHWSWNAKESDFPFLLFSSLFSFIFSL